ncbi:PspC domain-containing protein [Phycicoccus sp. BSK3Z-2]|uniref:PspC domain-containing protein n=1 Tax=Phycicoccus avicenniae TaxID=2828860 RepID=A0A941D7N1_9MICO|nr:PspC domain-containing protein [Phycicoccus avicenniae]MBR7743609.1 PspC domain-containing protein [Phycicoccus avicenniae]
MTDTSTGTPPQSRRGALDDTFDRLRSSSVRRDGERRWFGGVCAGIAARFDVDPLLIRAAAIALALAGGVAVPVYLVLWLLLPDADGSLLADRGLRHGDVWPVVLVVVTGLFVLGGLVSLGVGDNGWGGPVWLLLPVGVVVWLLASRAGRPAATAPPGPVPPPPPPGDAAMTAPPTNQDVTGPTGPGVAPSTTTATPATAPGAGTAPAAAVATPAGPPALGRPPRYGEPGGDVPPPHGAPRYGGPTPPVPPRPVLPPPPPRPRRRRPSGSVGLVGLGLAILLTGAGSLLAGPVGWDGPAVQLGFAVALAGVSLLVLGLGLRGRASGVSGFLVLVLAGATGIATAAAHTTPGGSVGDRTWVPSATSQTSSYRLGAGEATLDLSGFVGTTPTDDPVTVTARVGAGELTIEVPEGLDVEVTADGGVGTIRHERLDPDGPTTVDTRDLGSGPETITTGDDAVVVVDVELGLGEITIEEG